jgi:hypothetical protein
MRLPGDRTRRLALVVSVCAAAISAGLQVQPASAQDTSATSQTAGKAVYYVDFRARTAASYGHAFIWYGRYGDLDEEYLTASYRVYMTEAQAKEVFAYIKHLQAISPVWNAATWNCVAFIQTIASHMGLRTPGNHLLYPEDWVNKLRALNGGRRMMPSSAGGQEAQAPAARPAAAAQAPAARPAAAQRRPAAPPASQVVEANPRT